jgi:hypothetical protein
MALVHTKPVLIKVADYFYCTMSSTAEKFCFWHKTDVQQAKVRYERKADV